MHVHKKKPLWANASNTNKNHRVLTDFGVHLQTDRKDDATRLTGGKFQTRVLKYFVSKMVSVVDPTKSRCYANVCRLILYSIR